MSQPVLLKVYGNLDPADQEMFLMANEICSRALPAENLFLEMSGTMLKISFEGIWFPADDLLAMIEPRLKPAQNGKLDILDIENWRLYRNIFANGKITGKCAPLNNVLDYSGH